MINTYSSQQQLESFENSCLSEELDDVECDSGADVLVRAENLAITIELKLASILLKLENYYHLPSTAMNEHELHFLLGSASQPISESVVSSTFRSHNLQIEESVDRELTITLCKTNPLLRTLGSGGLLTTAFK